VRLWPAVCRREGEKVVQRLHRAEAMTDEDTVLSAALEDVLATVRELVGLNYQLGEEIRVVVDLIRARHESAKGRAA
jgi:hypothetical protein